MNEFKYSDIFKDHWDMAKEAFFKEKGREPSLDELIEKLQELNFYYFY